MTRLDHLWRVKNPHPIHTDLSYDKKRDNLYRLVRHEVSTRIDRMLEENHDTGNTEREMAEAE